MINYSQKFILIGIPLTLLLFALGCSTSQKTADKKTPGTDIETTYAGDISELQQLLDDNRSTLSDVYASQNHDMPAHFRQKDSSRQTTNRDPFDGYRVQILSTRDITIADSVAQSFRLWADTTIVGYSAKAYQSFRQPYYKVHIGDFQQRGRANSFSQLIKRKYPDAWVVHDRIDPSAIPADTSNFMFKTADDTIRVQN